MRYLCFLIVGFILVSCSKDEVNPKPVFSNTDYFPNSTGSSWTYEGVFEGEMTVTGETKKFDGKEYSEIETIDASGSSLSYLFKSDGKYYLRGFVADVADIELLILKENESESATWKQSISANGGVSTFKYTIIEKNIEETIGSNTFQNVIIVGMQQSFTFLGTKYPLSIIVFHFAKGVGIIKIETEYDPITGLEDLNGISELVDYEIL